MSFWLSKCSVCSGQQCAADAAVGLEVLVAASGAHRLCQFTTELLWHWQWSVCVSNTLTNTCILFFFPEGRVRSSHSPSAFPICTRWERRWCGFPVPTGTGTGNLQACSSFERWDKVEAVQCGNRSSDGFLSSGGRWTVSIVWST